MCSAFRLFFFKYFTHFFFIYSHYRAILSCRSDKKVSVRGCVPFCSRSSGTAKRVRSINASNEPDSRTSPGMSSLVAIQTHASWSQVKFIIYSIRHSLLYDGFFYFFFLLPFKHKHFITFSKILQVF